MRKLSSIARMGRFSLIWTLCVALYSDSSRLKEEQEKAEKGDSTLSNNDTDLDIQVMKCINKIT